MSIVNYYEALDVEKGAAELAIKKSYRKLVLKYHPDKNPEDRDAAEEKIRLLNTAYETLTNPAKRAAYEAQIAAMEQKVTHWCRMPSNQRSKSSADDRTYKYQFGNIARAGINAWRSKDYRFGDVTRSMLSTSGKAITGDADYEYQFGDMTIGTARRLVGEEGAITKIAEHTPVANLAALLLHIRAGHYAHALRAVAESNIILPVWKREKVVLEGQSILANVKVGPVGEVNVSTVDVVAVTAQPALPVLTSLLMKIGIHYCELGDCGAYNKEEGNQLIRHYVLTIINDQIQGIVRGVVQSIPNIARNFGMEKLGELRQGMWQGNDVPCPQQIIQGVLPEDLPQLGPMLKEAIQRTVSKAVITHGSSSYHPVHVVPYHINTALKNHGLFAVVLVCFLVAPRCILVWVALVVAAFGLASFLNARNMQAWGAIRQGNADVAGIVCELQAADVDRVVEHLEHYIFNECYKSSYVGWIAGFMTLIPRLLGFFLKGKKDASLPVVLNIPVEAMWVGQEPLNFTIPDLEVAVLLDINLGGAGPYVACARVVIPDAEVHKVANSLCDQIKGKDLRQVVPQLLGEFVQPVTLDFEMSMTFPEPDQIQIELRNMTTELYLP